MSIADRKWVVVAAAVVLLLIGSWFYRGDSGPHHFPLLNTKCNVTTAGQCESLMGPSGFWEAQGITEYTITAEVPANSIDNANCYFLGTGSHGNDATTRMPKSWAFYGSPDGKQWDLLDTKSGQMNWKLNEARYYPIRKKAELRHVQLKIQSSNPGDIVRLYMFRLGSCSESGSVISIPK